MLLEGGIFISHIVWRIRYRSLRKEAKASGKSIDEMLDDTRTVVPDDAEKQLPTHQDQEKA